MQGGRGQRAAAPEDGREQEEMLGPPDAQQRPGFMDLHIAHGAVLVGLQVAHDAGFADFGGVERGGRVSPLCNPGSAPTLPAQVEVSPLVHHVPAAQALSETQCSPALQMATAPYPSLGKKRCVCVHEASVEYHAEGEPQVPNPLVEQINSQPTRYLPVP